MKKILFFLMLMIGFQSFSQFDSKKIRVSLGITGQYMTAPKYTGHDVNMTAISRYNFAPLNLESTISIEVRPQIGVGFRNWYKYGEYKDVFPMRLSYSIPVIINYNWGLNSGDISSYLIGFYFGVGYNYSNVISKTPPYEGIHGIVIDAGMRFNGTTQAGLMYTIGNDGSRIYSVGLYFDYD